MRPHIYIRGSVGPSVRPSARPSVTRFFSQSADYGRKWLERTRQTVWMSHTRQKVFRIVLICLKMSNSDASLSEWTRFVVKGRKLFIFKGMPIQIVGKNTKRFGLDKNIKSHANCFIDAYCIWQTENGLHNVILDYLELMIAWWGDSWVSWI